MAAGAYGSGHSLNAAGVLYCDEHFGSGVVDLLAAVGIQAETFRAHNHRQPDPVQLLFAAQRGWTILTRDRGFLRLHEFWYLLALWRPKRPALRHAGILVVPDLPHRGVVAHVQTFLAPQQNLRDSAHILSRQQSGALEWAPFRPYARHPSRV